MDRLSSVFGRFAPTARVFFAGTLCQVSRFDGQEGLGHLHLMRSGHLEITATDKRKRVITEPSIVFSPKPQSHELRPVNESGTDLICASIDLGTGLHNPFVQSLPDLLIIPIAEAPDLVSRIEWLFKEADGNACGRDAVLELLTEYVLILLLRHGMDVSETAGCILTGLGDERLSRAITAIHEHPEKPWTLEMLSDVANMSRARFAHHFRETTGTTPMEYLTDWRLSVSRTLLRSGEPINRVAQRVGYTNAAAFARAFSRRTGHTPREWLTADRQRVSNEH